MTTEQKQEIEYEQVSIKVPKTIMDFLRKIEDDAVAWIEYTVVENIAAELEGRKPKEWASLFHLTPIFKEILGKAYYKTED